MSWGWNTEFGQVDVWRVFPCIHNSLTLFSFFLTNIYRLRVGAVASAYFLLVIPWGWSNGFGLVDVWMMFAYLHSILVVVFLSCSTLIGLRCAVCQPLFLLEEAILSPRFCKGGIRWVGGLRVPATDMWGQRKVGSYFDPSQKKTL